MIKSLLLWVGLVLVSLVALTWGVLSMFSPRTLARAMAWYTGAAKWSTLKPNAVVSGSLSQRVGGFFAVLIAGWMLFILLVPHRLCGLHPSCAAPLQPSQSGTTPHDWSALVVGLFFNACGLYMLFRPELNVRMVQKNLPDRELSPDMVKQLLKGGRFGGAVFILFGSYLLFLWYRWTR